jgi:hypothetical protein
VVELTGRWGGRPGYQLSAISYQLSARSLRSLRSLGARCAHWVLAALAGCSLRSLSTRHDQAAAFELAETKLTADR